MPLPEANYPIISENDINTAQLSATQITNYAQASITLVPQLTDQPAWFIPIAAHILSIQNQNQNWLDQLCPATTTNTLQNILNFSVIFQNQSQKILDILDQIGNQNNLPTSAQRTEVDTELNQLIDAVQIQNSNAATLKNNINNFVTQTNTAQQQLLQDLNTVVANFSNGQDSVNQIEAVLGNSFLNTTQLGPCNVIVNIDVNISIEIDQLGTDPMVLSTVFIKIILENLLHNMANIQQPLQNLTDTWAILQKKYTALIVDLDDASDDDYTGMLKALDLQTAQTQWQQLADFINHLLTPTP